MMIYAITAIAILISIALALTRAILGPTSYDRILSANAIGTKTVLLIGDFLPDALTSWISPWSMRLSISLAPSPF